MRCRTLSLAVLLATATVACAPGAPPAPLAAPATPPPDRAVVYLYRPPSLLGTLGRCNVAMGDVLCGGLAAGEYTWVLVPPGVTRFETTDQTAAFVTVTLHPGREYFIRESWIFTRREVQPRLANITKIKALAALQRCRFVASPEPVSTPTPAPEPTPTPSPWGVPAPDRQHVELAAF